MTAIPSFAPYTASEAHGKFLHVGGNVFLIRGASYGTFTPREDGHQFPDRAQVRRDFDLMAGAGINTVRTYTVPPRDVLDAAAESGVRIVAGLAWSHHVAFLDERRLRRDILRSIGAQARAVAGHPALLLLAVGNEIPSAIVRWHGPRAVEAFIGAAVDEVRSADPGVPLTYVNYPPTEYLELPFLDVCAFNVYLHHQRAMRSYVARLQHIAGDRPLLLTECGADSLRRGEGGQAALAAMQLRAAFEEGAAGAIVFSWTDEWWRGGAPVVDWLFGLVNRERRPKAAYAAVADVFSNAPFADTARQQWPSVSVIVCAYNAAATIEDCLTALDRLDYTKFEIIVVDDGSTDATAILVRAHARVRLIEIANGGLSAARNVGLHAARHEIVVYVDADVRVEPSWLSYLVQPFITSDAVAVGGPNVVPRDDPWFAQCVARAPGAPNHVLIDDRLADHVPGCNLAIRRRALLSIRGFDPIFLRAGDDVDVCWRLQASGGRVAFSAAALVWHHHRTHLSAYWRQQVGYGEGEAWLRLRHRHRFSRSGILWRGRIYSNLPFVQSLTVRQVHSGIWGTAAFPSVYHTGAPTMQALPHAAEWQIGSALLMACGLIAYALGGHPASVGAIVAGMLGISVTVLKCAIYACRSDVARIPTLARRGLRVSRFVYRATIALLHIVQPIARSYGYIRGSLRTPAATRPHVAGPVRPVAVRRRRRRDLAVLLGRPVRCMFWSEAWTAADGLLTNIVNRLGAEGGDGVHIDDGWRSDRDVSVALGSWGWAHLLSLVEDHGTGRCLWRVRVVVRPRFGGVALVMLLLTAMTIAGTSGNVAITAVVAGCAVMTVAYTARTPMREVGRILDVITVVAVDHGMQPVTPALRQPRAKAALSRWRRLLATDEG